MKPSRLRHGLLVLAVALLAACGGSADREDPTATLTAPLNGALGITGTLVVAAEAADNDSVQRVEFQIDGVGIGEVETPPYTVNLDSGAFVAGQHIVRARSRDEVRRHSPWSTATVQFASARSVPAGFEKDEAFVTGLANATAFAQAADGRLFIAQQTGELRVVDADGNLLAAPFVQLGVDANGERGLIGVALHPDFASNGFVYVHYTTPAGGTHNRISRLTANGNVALAGSEQVLVELPALSSATNHNGGGMHFGADGKLYVGVGDNANGANARDLSSPLGKLLRFNDDGSVPDDNPNALTQSGLARAVWASGLRNPFSFAFEPGGTRLYINDVGEKSWEEVDIGAAGADYGWPDSEGPVDADGITGPRFTYAHAPSNPAGTGLGGFFVGTAITGAAFYPASGGNFPPEYAGNYFFADFGARFIGRLDPANDDAAYAFASVADQPVDLLVGIDGALYVLTRSGVTRIAVPT